MVVIDFLLLNKSYTDVFENKYLNVFKSPLVNNREHLLKISDKICIRLLDEKFETSNFPLWCEVIKCFFVMDIPATQSLLENLFFKNLVLSNKLDEFTYQFTRWYVFSSKGVNFIVFFYNSEISDFDRDISLAKGYGGDFFLVFSNVHVVFNVDYFSNLLVVNLNYEIVYEESKIKVLNMGDNNQIKLSLNVNFSENYRFVKMESVESEKFEL